MGVISLHNIQDEKLWYNDGMEWLKEWAVPLSAGATFLLAAAAFWAIWQNRRMHQKEFKIGLLDKIVEWVIDIQKTSLEVDIPVTSASLSKEQIRRIEANELRRYGIPFSKNEYIRAIAYEAFGKELQSDVENAIETFTIFMYLKGRSSGLKDAKRAFRGTAIKLIEEAEKQIEEENKTIDQAFNEYSEKLAYSMNVLLIKIGIITASF